MWDVKQKATDEETKQIKLTDTDNSVIITGGQGAGGRMKRLQGSNIW